jgi:hypothetical protein
MFRLIDMGVDGKIIIELIEIGCGKCGLNSSGSGYGPVTMFGFDKRQRIS